MADPYVWTKIFNCAKIGRKAIETYCKHHAIPVHVYGYEEDLSQIADHPLVRKERLPKRHALSYLKYHFRFAEKALSETELREAFVDGHLGTATLWSFIFKRFPYLELVHFDSDVLFFGEIVETIAFIAKRTILLGRYVPTGTTRAIVTTCALFQISSRLLFLASFRDSNRKGDFLSCAK